MNFIKKIIKEVQYSLPKSNFFRNALKITSGTGMGHLISLLFYPILSRIYTPEEFGVFAVFASVMSIIVVIGSLKYEFAIPLPKKDGDAINVLFLSFTVLLSTTVILSLMMLMFGNSLLEFFGIEVIEPFKWLLPVGVSVFGIFQNFNYWQVRFQKFGIIAKAKFIQATSVSITQLLLFSLGAVGLLLGHVTGYLISAILMIVLSRDIIQKLYKEINCDKISSVAKRFKKFPLISSFSGLINSLGLYIPAILLTSTYSPEIAGYFAITQRVISAPLSLIGKSVSQVYYSEATKFLNTDRKKLRDLFLSLTRKLTLYTTFPIILVTISGPYLFTLIFGDNWYESGIYLLYLTPMVIAQFVINPISQTLYILEKQFLQLLWDVTRLLVVIIVFILALKLEAKITILLYGIGMTLSYILLFFMSLKELNKLVESNG